MYFDIRNSTAIKLICAVNLLINCFLILFDLALVYCTIKNKKLHSTCHILLALYFFCYSFMGFGSFFSFFMLVNPWIEHIPLWQCAVIMVVPSTICYGLFPLMVATGFDRLLCVFFPIWYKMKNDTLHLASLLFFPILFDLYLCYMIVNNVVAKAQMDSTCALTELVPNAIDNRIFFCFLFTIICYTICLIKIWLDKRKGTPIYNSHNTIIKSLLLIMLIQISEWIFGISTSFLVSFDFGLGVSTQFQLLNVAFCMISFLGATEVPILYATSSEHRAAMRKQFPWFFKLFNKNFVQPTNTGGFIANSHVSNGGAAAVALRRPSTMTPIVGA